jgi:hypothetical protein
MWRSSPNSSPSSQGPVEPTIRANSFIVEAQGLNMTANQFYSVAFRVQSPYIGSDLVVSLVVKSFAPRFVPRVLLVLSRSADPTISNQRLAEKFIQFDGDYTKYSVRNSTVLFKSIQASAQPYYIHLTRAALPNDIRMPIDISAGLAFPLSETGSQSTEITSAYLNSSFADMKIQSTLGENSVDFWTFYLPSFLTLKTESYLRFNITIAIRFSMVAGAQVGKYPWWQKYLPYSSYTGDRLQQSGNFLCQESSMDTPVFSLAIVSGSVPVTYSASLQDYLGGMLSVTAAMCKPYQ